MSRRKLSRFTAAAILALVVGGVTLAQVPNPWRNAGDSSACTSQFKVGCVQFDLQMNTVPACPNSVAAKKCGTATVSQSACCNATASKSACCNATASKSACSMVKTSGTGFTGSWFREMPGVVSAFHFAGDTMEIRIDLNHEGTPATVTLTADYAISKDGTVHGVITGADVNVGRKADPVGMQLASLSLELQSIVDQPFAFRWKASGSGMMVSSVRLAGGPTLPGGVLPAAMLGGKYTPAGLAGIPVPAAATLLDLGEGPAGDASFGFAPPMPQMMGWPMPQMMTCPLAQMMACPMPPMMGHPFGPVGSMARLNMMADPMPAVVAEMMNRMMSNPQCQQPGAHCHSPMLPLPRELAAQLAERMAGSPMNAGPVAPASAAMPAPTVFFPNIKGLSVTPPSN